MWRVAAPAAMPSRMPLPSSPSAPTRNLQRRTSGRCAASIASSLMKPPVVSTTPRRARIARGSPNDSTIAPLIAPSISRTSATQRWFGATRASLRSTAASSERIRIGPAWCSICGT